MKWWSEIKAGAPIYRGRWAAIIWLWLAGYFAGDVDLIFALDAVRPNLQYRAWVTDAFLLMASIICLFIGVARLDQYGRNAWFTWAPDDVKWSGLKRSDVKRTPGRLVRILWGMSK